MSKPDKSNLHQQHEAKPSHQKRTTWRGQKKDKLHYQVQVHEHIKRTKTKILVNWKAHKEK